MHGVSGDEFCSRNAGQAFSGIVKKKCEQMMVNKYIFDADHPDNKKSIPHGQLMKMAAKKAMQDLAAPEQFSDES